MRRWRDTEGRQYDELPNSLIRERLPKGGQRHRHPGPYPEPRTYESVEAERGPLELMRD
ncbi:hypothetical protein ACFQ3T_02000 [Saccharothrix hoggarensis]|uniref:Uncharacterized protein n=2 Tax=Saccharothrix hoggarensis TaxID=913853 RepID=A0ABW3QNG4_9PSEU